MEMMIGLSILSLVLGMIFSTLYQETVLNRRIEKLERETMSKIEIQQRLDKIFANVVPIDPTSKNRPLYSSESRRSVFFYFDNGIDPDPTYSGIIKGSIGLDGTDFVLRLYEDDKADKPSRLTKLRDNIKSIQFEFLLSSPSGLATIPIWDKAINFAPLYVKMILNQDEEYVFWVNHEPEPFLLKGKT
ncbi:MAG: hypothetical protein KDK71_06870 [Chlamydiia bacterium]|nr:hypothetical protein [Chlamydiia bacterium]